jgi:hypothetical protein
MPRRFVDKRLGGRPKLVAAYQTAKRVQAALKIEFAAVAPFELEDAVKPANALEVGGEQRIDQLERRAAGGETDLLFIVGEHDVVDAGLVFHGPRLATHGARAGKRLKLQRNMLRDVAEPGAFLEALFKAAAHLQRATVAPNAGDQGEQGVGEAGQAIGREFLKPAEIHLHPHHWRVAEIMRPPVDGDFVHRSFLGQHCRACIGFRAEEHLFSPWGLIA